MGNLNGPPWLRSAGGAYDGFLLSTANSFPPGPPERVNGIREAALAEALRVSTGSFRDRWEKSSGLVGEIPCGQLPSPTPNKAIEHSWPSGPGARTREGPMLQRGISASRPGIITATGDILRR